MGNFIPDVYLNILRERYPHEFAEATDDTIAAAGDDLRDRALIESLIVNDDSPNPWDLA